MRRLWCLAIAILIVPGLTGCISSHVPHSNPHKADVVGRWIHLPGARLTIASDGFTVSGLPKGVVLGKAAVPANGSGPGVSGRGTWRFRNTSGVSDGTLLPGMDLFFTSAPLAGQGWELDAVGRGKSLTLDVPLGDPDGGETYGFSRER